MNSKICPLVGLELYSPQINSLVGFFSPSVYVYTVQTNVLIGFPSCIYTRNRCSVNKSSALPFVLDMFQLGTFEGKAEGRTVKPRV
jgi:hypothetical protein